MNADSKKILLRTIPTASMCSLPPTTRRHFGGDREVGTTGTPLLVDAPGSVECNVTSIVEQGDHHIVVGEVVDAHLNKPPTGRPDGTILEMKDLGDSVFYGG